MFVAHNSYVSCLVLKAQGSHKPEKSFSKWCGHNTPFWNYLPPEHQIPALLLKVKNKQLKSNSFSTSQKQWNFRTSHCWREKNMTSLSFIAAHCDNRCYFMPGGYGDLWCMMIFFTCSNYSRWHRYLCRDGCDMMCACVWEIYDRNFDKVVKWKNMEVKFVGQGHMIPY